MADLTQIQKSVDAQENAVAIPIYQPDGEPYLASDGKTQCTITVLGAESKKYRQAENAITRRNLRSKKPTLDPADIRRNRIEQAAAVCVDWFGWEDDGKPFPFTVENAEKLLGYDHILRQVEGGIHSHADFSRSASAS